MSWHIPGISNLKSRRSIHCTTDRVFQQLSSQFGRLLFFEDGIGDICSYEEWIASLRTSELERPSALEVSWTGSPRRISRWGTVVEGVFMSPAAKKLGLHENSRLARFALFEPAGESHKGAVLHLAGTGDHGYMLRAFTLAVPLLRHGVSSLVLENVMYGRRKPEGQRGAKLRRVQDLLALGRTTIEESRGLLMWMRQRYSTDKLVVAGCSMGGLHAAMTGSLTEEPVGIVAAYAPPSGVEAFVLGILRKSMTRQVLPHLPDALWATDIRNFPRRRKPAVLLTATDDLYVPSQHSLEVWRNHWPWAEVREVSAGHLTGIVLRTKAMREAVLDTLEARELCG